MCQTDVVSNGTQAFQLWILPALGNLTERGRHGMAWLKFASKQSFGRFRKMWDSSTVLVGRSVSGIWTFRALLDYVKAPPRYGNGDRELTASLTQPCGLLWSVIAGIFEGTRCRFKNALLIGE